MPTATGTFDIPDTLPAEQIEQIIAHVNNFAVASTQKVVVLAPNDTSTSPLWDVDDTQFPAPSAGGLYSPLMFAGAGKNQPGAVGGDVEEYLRDLRSEWDERDAR